MTEFYCEATHPDSPDGCYEPPNHKGQHRGIRTGRGADYVQFFWGEPAPVSETFSDEELAILITALQPVKHSFPDLEAKLERAREALK